MKNANYATKPKTILTNHQLQILRVIATGNGGPCPNLALVDMDEIVSRSARETTKASMHFVLRALVINGMITKEPVQARRGRNRVVFKVTPLGLHISGINSKPVPVFFEPPAETTTLETSIPGLI